MARNVDIVIDPYFLENDLGVITHIILPTEAFFLPDEDFIKIKKLLTSKQIDDSAIYPIDCFIET